MVIGPKHEANAAIMRGSRDAIEGRDPDDGEKNFVSMPYMVGYVFGWVMKERDLRKKLAKAIEGDAQESKDDSIAASMDAAQSDQHHEG
jgi:hypothetical protein